MKLKRVLASALLLATLLTLPAWAAQASGAKGEANITPDTPMAKIRSNPSVMGAGLYTYNQEQDTPRDIRKWKDTTLREYVNDYTAEDCAKGLNRMIENYNSGIQITYKLYTDEEIAAVPTRQKAEIYYFPGSDPGGKFVLVIGGNAIHTSAEMREGVSTAEWLNELGYTCFVLRYRIGDQATDNAPLEDVSRAVRYITEHAEQFHVQPEDYAVLAYSSGGQIAGLFASDSDTLGHKAYGVSKPGALLLGYPVSMITPLSRDSFLSQIQSRSVKIGLDLSHSFYFDDVPNSVYLCINHPNGDIALAVSCMEICEKLTPPVRWSF